MSNVGIIMLVHTAFDRAAQVARHWHKAGCPVVIHVDSNVDKEALTAFQQELSDLKRIRFSTRHRCEWGTWGLVAATQNAAELMLSEFQKVNHVLLASGACLPLRPVEDLQNYLKDHSDTDFIEAVNAADVRWIVGGLSLERFTLYFPFSWRKRRLLFDSLVTLQRAMHIRRSIPKRLVPHMGSQWWCLTRETLSAILNDPQREDYDRYFRLSWIPDESYFQTLARKHSRTIESRSLTLSKFDYLGKPYVFYDDHLPILKRSDCFLARKIWPHANRLYGYFLSKAPQKTDTPPNPSRIDRIFSKAVERRTRGRPGLVMQSRFPNPKRLVNQTAGRYTIFEGFTEILDGFETWLAKTTKMTVHGHLFAPERAEFSDRGPYASGALSDHPKLRDYNAKAFLINLLWNTRGIHQCFQFGPADSQKITETVVNDTNASVYILTGAWILNLMQSDLEPDALRKEAARLQAIEKKHLDLMLAPTAKAFVKTWTLSEFTKTPHEILHSIHNELPAKLSEDDGNLPPLKPLDGLPEFLLGLKNSGMNPYLMGDLQMIDAPEQVQNNQPKFYIRP